MKFPALFLSCLLLFAGMATPAIASFPLADRPGEIQYPVSKNISVMKLQDFQKLIGRKLTFKEKIAFVILKYKARHQHSHASTGGKVSAGLGIASLGLALMGGFVSPVLWLAALVAAIFAVVLGSKARRKDPNDKDARLGKLLGWITLIGLSLFAVFLIILIANWEE